MRPTKKQIDELEKYLTDGDPEQVYKVLKRREIRWLAEAVRVYREVLYPKQERRYVETK